MAENEVVQLAPETLQMWLRENKPLFLLDVREDWEVALCALPHHHHVPMNVIPLRHNELPDDVPIVVYCHHGVRSLNVARFLAHVGFTDLYNLQGGIDAWSVRIDAHVARY